MSTTADKVAKCPECGAVHNEKFKIKANDAADVLRNVYTVEVKCHSCGNNYSIRMVVETRFICKRV